MQALGQVWQHRYLMETSCNRVLFMHFYPIALKGCQGIVFIHGVQMGGWVAGWREKFVRPVSQKP